MSFRLPILGLIALVLLLAACAPPPLRDQTLLADSGLISGEPCASPCWNGITPGETSWRDALTIVEDNANFENIQTQQDEESGTIGAVWQPRGGAQCCQMVAEDGRTVNLIFLRTAPNDTVGELFRAHGEPAYAVGTPFADDQAILNLIYPDIPMIIFAFVAGPSARISESSEIIGVLYTTSDDMDLFMQTNFLHEWNGYEPYADYRSDEGAVFEVTPSITLTPTPSE